MKCKFCGAETQSNFCSYECEVKYKGYNTTTSSTLYCGRHDISYSKYCPDCVEARVHRLQKMRGRVKPNYICINCGGPISKKKSYCFKCLYRDMRNKYE